MSFKRILAKWRGRHGLARLPAANEDWAVGDLAECIAKNAWRSTLDNRPGSGPEYGDVLRVRIVVRFGPIQFLGFKAFQPWTYHANEFRKLPPEAVADAAFTRDLRALQPLSPIVEPA